MSGRRGIAQLLVLWTLLLLGTLAAGFALSMRSEAQAARNGIDGLRAYYQARTGVSRAIMLLSTFPASNLVWTRIEEEEEDAAYLVEIAGEGGKIDINAVSEEDLFYILRKGGLSDAEAERVRDAILDWIDADDDPRPFGSESAEYARMREPLFPRNGKLASVEELRYIAGITQEFYGRFLSRVFTVHGNASHVNVSEASGIVLGSMPGVSPEAVAEILEKRKEGFPSSPKDLADMATRGLLTQKGLSALSSEATSRVYEITSTGRAGRGVIHVVKCLVTVGGHGIDSVRILRWVDLAARGEEY